MTDTIACALEALFDNDDLAFDVVYRAAGADDGVACRARLLMADTVVDFDQAKLVSESTVFLVPVASMPSPKEGDSIEWASRTYLIQGKPIRRDARRLVWTIDTVPA